jgi:hypothetical protein
MGLRLFLMPHNGNWPFIVRERMLLRSTILRSRRENDRCEENSRHIEARGVAYTIEGAINGSARSVTKQSSG